MVGGGGSWCLMWPIRTQAASSIRSAVVHSNSVLRSVLVSSTYLLAETIRYENIQCALEKLNAGQLRLTNDIKTGS